MIWNQRQIPIFTLTEKRGLDASAIIYTMMPVLKATNVEPLSLQSFRKLSYALDSVSDNNGIYGIY